MNHQLFKPSERLDFQAFFLIKSSMRIFPTAIQAPINMNPAKIMSLLVFDFFTGILAGSIIVTHGVCSCTFIFAYSSC